MYTFLASNPNKPNRLDSEAYPNKDDNRKYHIDYAKWCATNALSHEHNKWLAKVRINKRFYKGDQWFYTEDTEAFLQDDTGQVKNRIKIIHNLIRPMVEQYRGNAIILTMNATAKSVSPMSSNRREKALEAQLFKTEVANEFPAIGEIMKKNDATIGENEEETRQIFENLYVDNYVKQINNLMTYVKNLNELDNEKIRVAQNLALTGIAVAEGYEHGGHHRWEIFDSEDFFFDRNARRYDLTDSSFMGRVSYMDPSTIFEIHQNMTPAERRSVETFVSLSYDVNIDSQPEGDRPYYSSKIPVYKTYWRDLEKEKYGWVMDEYGYPYLTRIDYTYPGEERPRYTEADLIEPPESPRNRKLFKGKKTRMMYYDIVRYCFFIPAEILSGGDTDKIEKGEVTDVLLDFGRVPYQETEYLDLSNVKFPIKAYTWGYIDGEIFSPVDDAINPQRFINRILSVTESQINISGGANVIIDKDAIDGADGEDQVYSDVAQGKPITIRSKGRGIPNMVGAYDATPKMGTYKMFEIIPIMKQFIQDTTGVNEALKGESIGQDQLVGVTNALIQRGSLMQEPFYNAIAMLYIQIFQSIANVGKRIYIDNERELAIATGDDGVEVLKLSPELRNEDFRVFIKRDNSDDALRGQANNMLMTFLQMGFIDEVTFSNMFDRATPADVSKALRESTSLRIEQQRRAAKAQEQQEAQMAQEMQAMQAAEAQRMQQQEQQAIALAQAQKAQDQQHDIDKIMAKGLVDVEKEKSKNIV